MTDEETPISERGDIVYGDDPFKGENLHHERVNDGDVSMIELCDEYSIGPPALTTHSARRILQRR